MDKKKDVGQEISDMLRGVPPRNILISFGDKPARPMDEILKEQQRKSQKKRKERER